MKTLFMNNYSNFVFPSVVFEAFPILKKLGYVRQFAPLVPLYSDTTFHLFGDNSGQFLILVMTDYADPIYQSQELKNISGEYAFEFTKLIKPYCGSAHVDLKANDELLENPTVSGPNSYYRFYVDLETTRKIDLCYLSVL
ncbi:hypothetical protein KOY49_02100 [Candidatus Minimicrobia vallesae]|uniref:Uncharacterized protein n=1 Tax=Candidatus Minimicrobia vallesae TaxID=2841264 RepID=A0A8F1SB91_9BACT|nr:hypothetical protein [Candidatus Minimicrobia vallesae]QWQ31769.1 hypothetical protein KOY49_02100 [Candidatus Minimicrobia vallesae]